MLLYFHEDIKKNSTSHYKSNDNGNGIRLKEETFKFCLLELGYIILLILAFFGCVSQFRSYWKLIEVYFLPGNCEFHFDCIFNVLFLIVNYIKLYPIFSFLGSKHISRIICQFYGMLVLFILYCGTSLHGGIFLERKRHSDGFLFPNFFLTYLLATKVKSKKSNAITIIKN